MIVVGNSINPDLASYFRLYVEVLQAILGPASVTPAGHSVLGDGHSNFLVLTRNPRPWPVLREVLHDLNGALRLAMFCLGVPRGTRHILFTSVSFQGLLQALAARAVGATVITVVHDYAPHPGRKAIWVRMNLWVVSMVSRRLVVHSRIGETALGPKADYLPLCGFESRMGASGSQGLGGEGVLLFGRGERYQGFDKVFQIAALMPDVNFTVASRGMSGENHVARNVRLIGRFLSDDEVSSLMASADCVLLPYDSATQSGVIPQAYAHGCPVVVAPVGALPEYVEDGASGVVADGSTPEALARGLRRALGGGLMARQELYGWYLDRFGENAFRSALVDWIGSPRGGSGVP